MQASLKVNDDKYFGKSFQPVVGENHVLVVLPGDSALLQRNTLHDVVLYGTREAMGADDGISLGDNRNLSRSALTAKIIESLEETHVVLVKSPPMTGKTSLATLVSHALVDKSRKEKKKATVLNFSVLGMSEHQTFDGIFKERCKVEWQMAKTLHYVAGRMMHIILDEAQVIYRDDLFSLAPRFDMFWEFVKLVKNDSACGARILMFVAYGFHVQYTHIATPVTMSERMVIGIKDLNFSHDEVFEYVANWFKGKSCLESSAANRSWPAMEEFCVNLEILTGSHVGLCAATIHALNQVYHSRHASELPSADEWIRMLRTGSLYEPGDDWLFNTLETTRAMSVLRDLKAEDFDQLELTTSGANSRDDTATVEKFIRRGILVENGRLIDFSSSLMWTYFLRVRVGESTRAVHAPRSLSDMIKRVLDVVDHRSISKTLGKSLYSGIFLERAWQMEFYKAALRCTPSQFVTSADVGALFGSRGFVDITVHMMNLASFGVSS